MLKDHILYFLTGCLVIFTFWHIATVWHIAKVRADNVIYSLPPLYKSEKLDIYSPPAVLPVNADKVVSLPYIVRTGELNKGTASWYDYQYPKGSGNWVTKHKLVAASRDFPRGSMVQVCRQGTDTCVILKITDYGPEAWTGRVIDMGSLAFSRICSLRMGLCEVEATLLYGAKN